MLANEAFAACRDRDPIYAWCIETERYELCTTLECKAGGTLRGEGSATIVFTRDIRPVAIEDLELRCIDGQPVAAT